eukprot:m.132671 g.132671  ORF g.132671 m.132671 type:complete len:337 (+) comp38084_c0_seq4:1015-2025(+)
MTLYLEEPDESGHFHGPGSKELNMVLNRIDITLARLLNGMEKRNMTNCVDMIIVSDHGMTEVSPTRVSYLDEKLPTKFLTVRRYGPFAQIENADGVNLSDVSELIFQNESQGLDMQVYLKQDLPRRFHYSNSDRISPLVAIASLGWLLAPSRESSPYPYKGTHGYDNREEHMEALFVASGPSFKRGHVVDGFPNIELYNLMAQLLGIEPAPNNGTFGSLREILQNSEKLKVDPKSKGTAPQPSKCQVSDSSDAVLLGTVCVENKVPLKLLTDTDKRLVSLGYSGKWFTIVVLLLWQSVLCSLFCCASSSLGLACCIEGFYYARLCFNSTRICHWLQ